jgi:hypothetical protein
MPYHLSIDAKLRIATLVCNRLPTLTEWPTLFDEMQAHPGFGPGFGFLIDRRAITEPAETEYVHSLVAILRRNEQLFVGTRCAVIVPNVASYGMMRMMELMLDGSPFHVRGFKEFHKAARWLLARGTTTRP